MGIEFPARSASDVLASVVLAGQQKLGKGGVERFLVYAPDAVGLSLYRDRPDLFEPVLKWAPVEVKLRSVMPPKTPVCFASMFTGAPPQTHGITKYEKPVLSCDTLFDSLTRAGRRVAIVAVKDSSIDMIFRGRPLDYFSESYDDIVTDRVLKLIQANRHEFILAYHQEYDDVLHETTPSGPEAMDALTSHIKSFDTLAGATKLHWKQHNRAVMFAPDHGAHVDPATGRGTHGEDIPEDMKVIHFFGFYRSDRGQY
jgi:hypothetical protein